jgi:hypothetical protein
MEGVRCGDEDGEDWRQISHVWRMFRPEATARAPAAAAAARRIAACGDDGTAADEIAVMIAVTMILPAMTITPRTRRSLRVDLASVKQEGAARPGSTTTATNYCTDSDSCMTLSAGEQATMIQIDLTVSTE